MNRPTINALTPIFFTLVFLFQGNFSQAQDAAWRVLPTGAGGWVTGMSIHPSGHPVFVRVDVGSAYRVDRASMRWTN